MQTLPYLTAEIEPLEATIKGRYEDFHVEEIPAYLPCGQGDHIFFRVRKKGLSTARAIRDIARALNVAPGNIGAAGMKDARGVTVQTFSLEHADPDRIAGLELPRIEILDVSRHRNKLKTGHLRGNAFVIRLRRTNLERIADVQKILERLSREGVPNYYGSQRFGARGDTWEIGRALIRRDYKEAVELIAGRAGPLDEGSVLDARRLFDEGRYQEAARAWPRGFEEAVSVCKAMAKDKDNVEKAAFSAGKRALSLYVSAFQSELFNRVLAERIGGLGRLEDGDLAYKHENGAVFSVEDAGAEQPRCDAFEISPTGPLYGKRLKRAGGEVGEREHAVLVEQGLALADFPDSGPIKCAGGRRPLRFKPDHASARVGADDAGEYIELRFALDAGSYATTLIREICKDALVEARNQIA